MVFSSITFIYYFLPVVLLLYFIVPKKYKNIILLFSSIVFYIYGDISYLLVLVFSCISNYILGLLIDKYRKHSKIIVGIAIGVNLIILIYFKYTNFLINNINLLLNIKFSYLNIVLPLGISFYTFQNLSYVIDVYRKEVTVNKNFINYATYIFLFPQLIAGPIVRYKDISKQLIKRECSFSLFSSGVIKFIIGLSKKVLLANALGEGINSLYNISNFSYVTYLLIALFYTLQIYFDFSGYSDMAIGLGRMFGFKFNENFNYPFIARSITDFWRRWHISLSSFFKDYVYIPLGGSRCSKKRNIINLFIVWLLTGIWHGAGFNFIIWGLYFFIILVIEKLLLKDFLDKHKIFGHVYTVILVIISFTIFSITDISSLGIFLKNLLGFGLLPLINNETLYILKSYLIIMILSIVLSTPIIKIIYDKNNKYINGLLTLIIFILFILVTANLVDSSFNPFLYFKF